MTFKVGINGFGRIGRMVFRAAVQHFPDIEIVGINDLLEPDYLAYMLRYDSVHGRFMGDIGVDGKTLVVNGKRIRLTAEKDPAQLEMGGHRRRCRRRVDRAFPDERILRETPRGGREEGDHVRTEQGRHPDVRVWRER